MSDDSHEDKSSLEDHSLNRRNVLLGTTTLAAVTALGAAARVSEAQAQQSSASGRPPNIFVIMGDDVGWFNIGAYHQGMMSGKTSNLDRLASEGMRFTDYYAEASCTAGRANFITGGASDPHRHDNRWTGGRRRRHSGSGGHTRQRA